MRKCAIPCPHQPLTICDATVLVAKVVLPSLTSPVAFVTGQSIKTNRAKFSLCIHITCVFHLHTLGWCNVPFIFFNLVIFPFLFHYWAKPLKTNIIYDIHPQFNDVHPSLLPTAMGKIEEQTRLPRGNSHGVVTF